MYEELCDMEKSTEELLNELQKAEDYFQFVKENEDEMENQNRAGI